ncbi:hypothetical protein GCM10007972_13440 [Iodidimonas muriae]|uniref:MobA-like NTP transferase domain-containing protein n=1 Tax=Iodidimonas muriae TaxID=261467 RepID=A0ABQ2LD26_9PROT|nr:nucleotidyltransferase family protein [Iodidimonas muriae]GER07430.1 hypothetical protein JCM17843_17400 [Kordiimonadales bacterium JCM 17843]GGO10545.1 hypothetical protein GCM10007972_13440 [Iodidimonas muriae]
MTHHAYRVLILAGRRAEGDPVAADQGVSSKAFVPLAGKPMIEHVLAAIEGSGRAADIRISMAKDSPLEREAPHLAQRLADGDVVRHQAAKGPSASVLSALKDMKPGERLFVTTADHPLLTGDLVRQFLDEADRQDADIAAALAPLALVEATYPRGKRTKLAFRDGAFSGCNMFAMKAPQAVRGVAFWRRIEHDRKKPLRLVARLGIIGLVQWFLGRLTLADALGRLGQRVDLKVVPVILHDADAATDIDSLQDLELARHIFQSRLEKRSA